MVQGALVNDVPVVVPREKYLAGVGTQEGYRFFGKGAQIDVIAEEIHGKAR